MKVASLLETHDTEGTRILAWPQRTAEGIEQSWSEPVRQDVHTVNGRVGEVEIPQLVRVK